MMWLRGLIISLGLAIISGSPVAAQSASLQIRPLYHQVRLEAGESKRGVIDVANPTDNQMRLDVSVQAFRQVDEQGNLEFYDDETIAAGVSVDQDTIELEARQAYRLVFEVDGQELETGDVFAAVFFTTQSDDQSQVSQAVRLGSLLLIEHGEAGPRQVEFAGLSLPWLVMNGQLRAEYSLANSSSRVSGFRPEIRLQVTPFALQASQLGPLVMAGNQRSDEISLKTQRIGLYQVQLDATGARESRWVLFLPWWFLLGVIMLVGLVVVWFKGGRKLKTLALTRRR